jgi:malonate-semialdehyde dehydrogenase (acetylating)/methylmalonate-semialdehyde dehydrogenase
MALSVAVLVGEARNWIPDLVAKAKSLRVGAGKDNPDLGPLISCTARERVASLIAQGVAERSAGLDGREVQVDGYPDQLCRHFSGVTTDMAIYQQEIFGPVLCLLGVDTLEEAIAIINANPNGNTAIFTQSGAAARRFQETSTSVRWASMCRFRYRCRCSALPARAAPSWATSAPGKQVILFYTQTKTVTSRWFDDEASSGKVHTTISLR